MQTEAIKSLVDSKARFLSLVEKYSKYINNNINADRLSSAFADVLSYIVAKKFGNDSASQLKRTIEPYFDDTSWVEFNYIKWKHVYDVSVSDNYIVVNQLTVPSQKLNEIVADMKNGLRNEYFMYEDTYIIGVNVDNGKLFIHKVAGSLYKDKITRLEAAIATLSIKAGRDDYIRAFYLRYHRDSYFDDVKLSDLVTGNKVRVQGDLVFLVMDIDMYHWDVIGSLSNQLAYYTIRDIISKVVDVLGNHGISVRDNGTSLTIGLGTHHRHQHLTNKYTSAIMRLLYENIDLSKYVIPDGCRKYEVEYSEGRLALRCGNENILGIEVATNRGNKSIAIAPVIYRPEYLPEFNRLVNESEDILENNVGVQYVSIGRHHIEYYGYPRSFVINYNNRIYIYNAPPDLLGVKKWIRVAHPEHSEFYEEFNGAIRVLHVFTQDVEIRNVIALTRLIKQYAVA